MQGSTVPVWEKLHSKKAIFGTSLSFSLFQQVGNNPGFKQGPKATLLSPLAFQVHVPMLWAQKAKQTLTLVGSEPGAVKLMLLPPAVVGNLQPGQGSLLNPLSQFRRHFLLASIFPSLYYMDHRDTASVFFSVKYT